MAFVTAEGRRFADKLFGKQRNASNNLAGLQLNAMCRRQEFTVFHLEFPILSKLDIKVEEPVELIPCTDNRLVLVAPQIVPGAHRERNVIHESHRILVKIENKSRQYLGGQSRIGDQQATRSDVVVCECQIEKAVDIQAWRRRRCRWGLPQIGCVGGT